ncbi:MAG: DNA modification methylase [Planctomycetes bacterium]|nr:DNA modification methylase [Planctomycetota bacterium]
MNIRRVRLDEIHNDPANARLHDTRNVEAITASLKTFGQCEPLVVQRGTGKVIAGNGRLTAMRALGWTECDVVDVEFDDLKSCALAIAMNRTSELGAWNDDVLATLLEELRREDQLDGVGFDDREIDKLLAEMADETPKDLDDPGPQEPAEHAIAQLGDLWILGEHRLLVGDSLKADDVARLLGGERSKLLSSDPPYLVSYVGNDRPAKDGGNSGKDWSALYHEGGPEDAADFYDRYFQTWLPHVAENVAVYVWHAHTNYVTLAQTMEKHGLFVHQTIVWSKPCSTFGHSVYRWKHEPCAFGWRRGFRPPHTAANFESVWEVDWDGKARVVGNFHPTEKPTRLFEIPMLVHTLAGDVVFEPFSGSGSNLIAAEKLSRRCRAMELQPVFVDGTIRRWQTATGKTATLEGSGKTFAEVEAERAEKVTS